MKAQIEAELLEKKEKAERQIRRLGRRALKERRYQEWLKELQAAGKAEEILDRLTADQLESMGKSYAREARKAQKNADACFILASGKRRKEVQNARERNEQKNHEGDKGS